MHVLPVILDARPEYLRDAPASASLLQLPLGEGSYFEELQAVFRAVSAGKFSVVSELAGVPGYGEALRRLSQDRATVLTHAQFAELLARTELSDWVLLWDARYAPPEDLDVRAICDNAARTRWIHRWFELESSQDGAREYVEVNASGSVNRIRRYYDGITWLQVRHTTGLLSNVATLRNAGAAAFASLGELHLRLVSQGTPCHDVPFERPSIDLGSEAGYLTLAHASVAQSTTDMTAARIDPSARLIGPVLVQPGAAIEARATIIGPSIIGRGGRIGADAFVAHSAVCGGASVNADERVLNRIVSPIEGSTPAVAPDERLQGTRLPESPDRRSPDRAARRRELYLAGKRWVEAAAALIGLVLLSPVMLLVAALVKLDSRGGVLFGHEREGRDGEPFRCWKFRTMVADAHLMQRSLYAQNAVDGPQFKLPRDPRVTRMGEFLRKSNLDELPQLFNVMLGQMSLIGPRPSPFRENQICVPWRLARLSVRPGITGLWQICRQDRDAGDFHQWIRFDSLYVRHVGFWLDVKILLATFVSLGGRWSVPVSWIVRDQADPAGRLDDAGRAGFVALPFDVSQRDWISAAASDPTNPQERVA